MRLHPAHAFGPMHFPTLVSAAELSGGLETIIADLLARKAVTRELGNGAMLPEIAAFMEAEFDEARRSLPSREPGSRQAARGEAEAFFRRMVRTFDGPPA